MGMEFTPIQWMESATMDPTQGLSRGGSAGANHSFRTLLENSLAEVSKWEAQSAADDVGLVLGTAEDLAQIQINALKAETALQTTVQLTSRMVNAYKEVMQMQV